MAGGLIVATACGSATPTQAPEASTAPPSSAQPSATDGQPWATDGQPSATDGQSSAVASPSPNPDVGSPLSETLIAAALAAGTITYEQSLLYRALALFDSPGLPEEFRSPVPDMDAATALLGEIDQKEAELSPGLLEQLAPYRARPADPISIFNNPPSQGSRGIVLAVATPPPTWVSRPVDGTDARVWVKDSPFTETQLERFAVAVDRVWPQLPGVFRYGEPDMPGDPNLSVNPDSAIDIYFVDTGTIDPRRPYCQIFPGNPECVFMEKFGYTIPAGEFHGTSSSGFVVLNGAQADDQLIDTVAHELTHVGQFGYDWNESMWLMESTATWAAYRVMQKLDLVPADAYLDLTGTQFFAELFLSLAQPRVHGEFHSYASWLFFLFASMEAGDAIVTKIWEAAAAEGVQSEKAVDGAFPFDDHFADFALRNWNQDPVTPQYKDADASFPGGLKPEPVQARVMTGAGETELDRLVFPLSSIYYSFEFKPAVRKVTFKNTLTSVPHAHVWAIKKIGLTWAEPEDWSGDAMKEFCRDVAEENVTQLVIVVSNSDSDMSASQQALPAPDPRVVTDTTGCVGWVGEIRGQTRPRGSPNWNNGYQETSLAQVRFIPNPWGAADDVEFVLGSGTVSWTSQWIVPPTDMSKPDFELCPTTVFSGSYEPTPYDQFTQTGDGELDFRPPTDGAPTAGPDSSQYALRQYEAGGLSNLSGNSDSIIPYVPCEHHGGVSSMWWHVPREALATASADGRTIEGTWTSIGGESESTWTWTLHYVGPPS